MKESNSARGVMLKLVDHKCLIKNMPLDQQAFRSMRTTWKKYEDGWARASLSNIFGPSKDVLLSRSDLRKFSRNNELDKFIMATIVWGYPSGMRGKNFDRLLEHIEALKNLLMLAQDGPVNDWGTHFQGVEKIPGLGLSTYTKLLNFMSVRVGQFQALILDERIQWNDKQSPGQPHHQHQQCGSNRVFDSGQ